MNARRMTSYMKALIWFGVLNLFLMSQIDASTSLNENENKIPDGDSNLVITKSGPVSGIKSKTPDGKIVNIYYGIPYAVPPVGELRFQPPRMVSPWTSTIQAVKPSPMCYQEIPRDVSQMKQIRHFFKRPWSEDCLTLNIWKPDPQPENAKVVVFIHGGGFMFGSSTMFLDGTNLALEDLILVTMNYRVGVLGFLGLGHDDAPGNVGLMDQNVAMQWVKNNIEAFGGDPNDITLMGVSAGSASVGYHLLSPMSKGLFQRSIMMSGAPTNWWAIREPEESVANAKTLSNNAGCPAQNLTSALECLRSKHPEDILDASRTDSLLDTTHFIPSVDGKFIVEHPSVSVTNGKFNPGEVILGTTRDEAGMFMELRNSGYFKTKDGRLSRRDFSKVIKKFPKGLSDVQVEALNVAYTDWTSPDDPIKLRDAARDIYSDGLFNCHVNEFGENLVKSGGTVYRYVFDYMYDIMKIFSQVPDWSGPAHGVDQFAVLGPVEMLKHFSAADLEVTRKFVTHITNFIKTGNPNLRTEEFPDEPDWPNYTGNQQYTVIGKKTTIHNHPRARECAAWMKLLPVLQDTHC